MINLTMRSSSISDVEFEVSIEPEIAYKILELLNRPNLPTKEEFIRRFVNFDCQIDYTLFDEYNI